MIVAGNHIYEQCGYCGKLVRMTGWFARLHFCMTEEERRKMDVAREQMRNQQRTFPANISTRFGVNGVGQGFVDKD
jgi:hypothetical protein